MGENLTWQHGEVTAADRQRALGQEGAAVWLTGLSGSGKSTIAVELERQLIEQGRAAFLLDGDNLRHGLCADLGFSTTDRAENIRRVGHVARLFVEAGLIVVSAFISPCQADRDRVRALFPVGRFLEVWVSTPLALCEARDPKGLYRAARAGEIPHFTGISAPYEVPRAPDLVLETADTSAAACARQIAEVLDLSGGRGAS